MTIQYEGGYFMIPEPMVRGYGLRSHTAQDMSNISTYTIEALNAIQETPWEVNVFMLDAIKALQDEKQDIEVDGKVLLRFVKPENPKGNYKRLPAEEWEGLTKEARNDLNKERARKMEAYEEALGVWQATKRVIGLAEEMSYHDHFYFPHNMDFRLRVYPIPTDLTPQSSDLSKGLLMFSNGTPLGAEGLYWLAFNVANHWGEDKLSSDDRVAFTVGHDLDPNHPMHDMEAWVDDPTTNRGWMKADKPFQFLAAAYEWVWANRLENPEEYLSFIPGSLDGSCNGAQHLSILARDLVGAEATNCRAGLPRQDLYQEVADRVWTMVQELAAKGDPVAVYWVPKMSDPSDRRKVVKRAVMTVPYGVSPYGVAQFMISDKRVERSEWEEARGMRDWILASIDQTLSKGRTLQGWFSRCAAVVAAADKPLQWDTPAGSKVTQAYRHLVQKRIKTLNTKFVIYNEVGDDIGFDVKKTATSTPPNVIHSCDAAHMQITVVRMADAGIKDFSMVHDSFGCPMAHVGLMRDILRQSVVDMYSGNYLWEWKESVEKYSGVELEDPPELGEFDIEEILESEFFFS